MDPNALQEPTPAAGFDFNRPTIIGLLYLSSAIFGVTALIGVVLAYVWRGEPHEAWEETHYRYLIRTFWIALVGTALGLVLMIALVGFILLPVVGVLVIVRTVLSLVKAQKREAMPNPDTWIA